MAVIFLNFITWVNFIIVLCANLNLDVYIICIVVLNMSENPYPGDIVQIRGKSKLIPILKQFSPKLKCISPFDIEDVSEAFAMLIDETDRTFEMNGNVFKVFSLMLDNSEITLPEVAFDVVERGNAGMDDLGASLTIQSNFDDENTDRRKAEELMIHHMAAESIQSAFR